MQSFFWRSLEKKKRLYRGGGGGGCWGGGGGGVWGGVGGGEEFPSFVLEGAASTRGARTNEVSAGEKYETLTAATKHQPGSLYWPH